ncbi:hypothetical protein BC828DRAFT_5338 [Blastocladiella britannica]|nr:hypothetical protein BC828DRAFT_5338 [Blastocladiella britannica]
MNALFASRRTSISMSLGMFLKPSDEQRQGKKHGGKKDNKKGLFERLASDISEVRLVPSPQPSVSASSCELEAVNECSKTITPTELNGGTTSNEVATDHHHGKKGATEKKNASKKDNNISKEQKQKSEKPAKLRSNRAPMPRGNSATAPGTAVAGRTEGYPALDFMTSSAMDLDAFLQLGAIVEGTLEAKARLSPAVKVKKPLLERMTKRLGRNDAPATAKVAPIFATAAKKVEYSAPMTSITSSSDTVVGRISASTSAESAGNNSPCRKSVGDKVVNFFGGLARRTSSGSDSEGKKGYARYESSSSVAGVVHQHRDNEASGTSAGTTTADAAPSISPAITTVATDMNLTTRVAWPFATNSGTFLPLEAPAAGATAQLLFLPMLPEAPVPLIIKDRM